MRSHTLFVAALPRTDYPTKDIYAEIVAICGLERSFPLQKLEYRFARCFFFVETPLRHRRRDEQLGRYKFDERERGRECLAFHSEDQRQIHLSGRKE